MHHPERELAHTVHSLLFKKEFDPAERVLLYSQLREGLINRKYQSIRIIISSKIETSYNP
jgi:hypothetical protein